MGMPAFVFGWPLIHNLLFALPPLCIIHSLPVFKDVLFTLTVPLACLPFSHAQEEEGISDYDGDPSSGASTPHSRAVGARKPARASGPGAGNAAAAGRHALREALRSQAAKAKRPGAPGASNCSVSSGAADDGCCSGSGGGGGGEFGSAAAQAAVGGALDQEQQPPQAKLGRLPKNARLIEAMAQHKNAKPKPKGWLLAIVDSIYRDGGGGCDRPRYGSGLSASVH
jgi:hypothetical protein